MPDPVGGPPDTPRERFFDEHGKPVDESDLGPGGWPLPSTAPPRAVTFEPLWLDDEGEVLNPKPSALLARNKIKVEGKKFKGRTVGGPQKVKRDRAYRETLSPQPPPQTFKRTDLMVDFSGNVTADQVFYTFLAPATGLMDKFTLSAAPGTVVTVKSTPPGSAGPTSIGIGPVTDGVVTSPLDLEAIEAGLVEFTSNQTGPVTISCILRSQTT